MSRSVHLVFTLVLLGAASAFAQSSDPLEPNGSMLWGAIGMQGDLGGGVNSSGIGLIGTRRAEVDRNTWGERYDAALVFRIGGAYNLTTHSQLFAAFSWQQA